MDLFKNKFSVFYFPFILAIALFASSCRTSRETTSTTPHEKNPPEKINVSKSKQKKIQEKYAAILSVDESKIDHLEMYSFIDEWYGVPYKYGGKNKSGIDCSNFASTLYSQVYSKPLTGSSSSIFDQCKVVSKNNLTEGDLVFFKIDSDDVSHIGVYLQNNKFVHATTKKGVMIDDLDEPYYKKYFYKAGRLK